MKRLIALIMTLVLAATFISSCKKGEGEIENYKYKETDEKTDYVCITMEDGGQILIQLRPDAAPVTVENFKELVSQKFYDGLIFHRVKQGFMIQGGDPSGNGTGGSGKTIYGEYAANGYNNPLSHVRGTVSMARPSRDYNGASSQFFICQEDYLSGDGQYAAFGTVIAGMDVVDRIASVPVDIIYNKPYEDQKMEKVRFVNVTEKNN